MPVIIHFILVRHLNTDFRQNKETYVNKIHSVTVCFTNMNAYKTYQKEFLKALCQLKLFHRNQRLKVLASLKT